MGILDKLFGKKKPAETRNTNVAKGLDVQSDAQRDASRAKMEGELDASRASRAADQAAKDNS